MKLMIIGYARSGKDTVAEVLRDEFGMNFESSSVFCLQTAIMPALSKLGYNYGTTLACMADRENISDWRRIWHDAILDYNTPDRARLGRALFAKYDIYVGNRHNGEFNALRNEGVFDYAIWVDAQDRGVPKEPRSSNKIDPWMADYTIDNNYTIEALKDNTRKLMRHLRKGA